MVSRAASPGRARRCICAPRGSLKAVLLGSVLLNLALLAGPAGAQVILPQDEGVQTDGTQTDGTQTDGTQTGGTQTDGTQTDGVQTGGTQTGGLQTAAPPLTAPATTSPVAAAPTAAPAGAVPPAAGAAPAPLQEAPATAETPPQAPAQPDQDTSPALPAVAETQPGLAQPGAAQSAATQPGQTQPGAALPAPQASAAQPSAQAAALQPPSPPSSHHGGETDLAGLVLRAHPVVQGVMGLLALASFAVLTVFLFKLVELSLAFHRLRRGTRLLREGGLGAALPQGRCPLSLATEATRAEVAALPQPLSADLRASATARLDLVLERIGAGGMQNLRSGSGLLASIGSVGPFVGLFGTVFGIMNSFLAIAATRTTNLAVVAPGIAEALLATALGLVAAIPAVLLYNRLSRRLALYRHRLEDGLAELRRLFSLAADRAMREGA